MSFVQPSPFLTMSSASTLLGFFPPFGSPAFVSQSGLVCPVMPVSSPLVPRTRKYQSGGLEDQTVLPARLCKRSFAALASLSLVEEQCIVQCSSSNISHSGFALASLPDVLLAFCPRYVFEQRGELPMRILLMLCRTLTTYTWRGIHHCVP